MDILIDVFVKILIAVSTMLAPILIFYLNSVSDTKKAKINSHDEEFKKLQENAKTQLSTSDTIEFKTSVRNISNSVANLNAQQKKDLQMLDPMRQFLRIYIPLVLSFFLIILDIMVRKSIIVQYNHTLSITLILASLISFIFSICFIYKIMKVLIDTKK